MTPLIVEQSRAIPVTVDAAFDATLMAPLPELMSHWYGPIPPIKAVREQSGSWGTPGQSRVLVLTGGGSAREVLTTVERPESFGYVLTEIHGPLAVLVGSVEGEWTFAPAGTGVSITWRWIIHPKSSFAVLLMPVFGRLWKGYARRALQRLSTFLVG
ncbi:MAG: SRPBCC family protein [Mycobacteriaceae bacterium]|nr:SRPBCC family protein [Mycobacteriaceae bacterium]